MSPRSSVPRRPSLSSAASSGASGPPSPNCRAMPVKRFRSWTKRESLLLRSCRSSAERSAPGARWSDSMTAIASAASAGVSSAVPSRRPRADHTEAGIAAIARPVSVTWSPEIGRSGAPPDPSVVSLTSTAPIATRLSIACRFGPAGSGSGSSVSSPPHTARAKTAAVRSEVATSGGVCSGRLAQSASDRQR